MSTNRAARYAVPHFLINLCWQVQQEQQALPQVQQLLRCLSYYRMARCSPWGVAAECKLTINSRTVRWRCCCSQVIRQQTRRQNKVLLSVKECYVALH